MSEIHVNLNNYFFASIIKENLVCFPMEYIVTSKGVIRRKERPICFRCSLPMSKNGSNKYTKAQVGSVWIGKWICPACASTLEEDRTFWEELKEELFRTLSHLLTLLRTHQVSFDGIQDIVSMFFPIGKETSRQLFEAALEKMPVPEVNDIWIVHYDEQYPKEGRLQKYRLTLLDGKNRRIIADELFDNKSPETILKFLNEHLDPNKPVFIVTDFDSRYPNVFDDFFKNGCFHQLCLLHLNKLIVKDFKHQKSLGMLYLQYEFLNVFYDRGKELRFLKRLIDKQKRKMLLPDDKEWLKKARREFFEYVHKLETRRRRRKETLPIRTYEDASKRFMQLINRIGELPPFAQTRVKMMRKKWENLTMFYGFDGAPATNNKIENYYSASLKTDKKRKFRTDRGILEQMKLARLKMATGLRYTGPSFFEIFRRLLPFSKCG